MNDYYLNTSTGNVYRCTIGGTASVAKWVYVGNIKGPTGAQGPKGATGATGPTGAQGPKGDKGDTPTDATNMTTDFTQASTRENIASGEKQGTIFGKIRKWFADLTAAAFAQTISSYADMMANTASGYLPDALAVKAGFGAITGLTNDKGKLYRLMTRASGNTISFDWAVTDNQRYLDIYVDNTLIDKILPYQYGASVKITEVQFPTKVSLLANQASYLQMTLDNITGYTPVMYDISLIGGAGIVPYGKNFNMFSRIVRIDAINLSNTTVTMQPTIRVLWVRDDLL